MSRASMDPDPVCQEHPFCQLCRTLKMAPMQSFSASARSHELAPTGAKALQLSGRVGCGACGVGAGIGVRRVCERERGSTYHVYK
jgi:hypothetical protein